MTAYSKAINIFFKHFLFVHFLCFSFNNLFAQATTDVKLHITQRFDSKPFELYKPYSTLIGDSVELTRFVYYISNIQLIRKDKTVWKQPESYHLLEVSEDDTAKFEIMLNGVPEGVYTQINFAIGIDSVRNHTGEQVGALDPDNGMFWMWETGYVFLKAEGFYHRTDGSKKAVVYHIGRDDCYRPIRLKLSSHPLVVKKSSTPIVQIISDARMLFGGFPGAAINLKAPAGEESISVMGGPKAPKIAKNYARMFLLPERKLNKK